MEHSISYSETDLKAIESAADAGIEIINSYVDRGEREDDESLDRFPIYNVSLHTESLKICVGILKRIDKDVSKYEAAIAKGEAFLNG